MVQRWAASLDMYRRVPGDLLEGTKRGGVVSTVAVMIMFTLIFLETRSFLTSTIVTDLKLDADNVEKRVRVNFNITMMDLKCDFVSIDTISMLGTQQNVTQHVTKWNLDANRVRQRYLGRNRKQKDIMMYDESITESHETMLKNGEDVLSLHPDDFEEIVKKNKFVFVDFYANWCSHCRVLAPTWERLAEVMSHVNEELLMGEEQEEWAGGRRIEREVFEGEESLEVYEGEESLEVYEGEESVGLIKEDPSFIDRENLNADESEDVGRRRLAIEIPNDMRQNEEDWKKDFSKEDWFGLPVVIARLDCVHYPEFCAQHGIRAYPTLRLFIDGEKMPDYHGDRTVVSFTHYLATMEVEYGKAEGTGTLERADQVARTLTFGGYNKPGEHKHGWNVEKRRRRGQELKSEWVEEQHPGCAISGFLMLDRTPGNFLIQAASLNHDIEPSMTNVSHEVHHLSFGEVKARELANPVNNPDVPDHVYSSTQPMDGNVYVTHNLHEAHHHYLKVVTTNFKAESSKRYNKKSILNDHRIYQIQQQSQLAFYGRGETPEARFSYDLSPIAVTYRRKYGTHWYDYLTSLVAIVGGTFTVFGLLDSTVYTIGKGVKKLL